MPKKNLFWQVWPWYLLVSLVSMIAIAWYASGAIRSLYVESISSRLELNAKLGAQRIGDVLDKSEKIPGIVRQIGQFSGNRVTVMLAGGTVIADTDQDPSKMENHAGRPEMASALQGRIGKSTRYSTTLGRDLVYVAVPVVKGNEIVAVVRVSSPLADVQATLKRVYRDIVLLGLLLAALTAAVSYVVLRRITRKLGRMERAATRFSQGNLDAKVPVPQITELKSLAEALNGMASQLKGRVETVTSQRNELEAVVSSMVEGVLVVDGDQTVVSINEAAAEMLSVDREKSAGQPVQAVIWNTELQELIAGLLSGQEVIEREVIIYSSTKRYIQARGSALARTGGTGAVIVLNDITRLKQLEDVRRDFVANVSHELKTPITSIKGFVETLREGAINDPENAQRFLEIIIRQANRLTAIIEDLLSLSRIEQESESGQIVLATGSINEVINNVVAACSYRAQARDMKISVKSPQPVSARINGPLLEQALINLVDNATKYSEPGREVEIETRVSGEQIAIDVQDHGFGIAHEHLGRIFERFYVADKARSRKLGGTGLGLAIVKHIVNAHGGKVSVQSQIGVGSTFTITLPVSK